MGKSLEDLLESTGLSGLSSAYVEDLYESFCQDPQGVPATWQQLFSSLPAVGDHRGAEVARSNVREQMLLAVKAPTVMAATTNNKQAGVDALIDAYRRHGHAKAMLDPIGLHAPLDDKRLTLSCYGLTSEDLDDTFDAHGLCGQSHCTLKKIHQSLEKIYCQTTAFQFAYVSCEEERAWLTKTIEQDFPAMQLEKETQCSVLERLTAAATLEKYLDMKFPGQKRFSIEGLDVLIPLLDEMAKRAKSQGVEEIIMGMAHRGRLNVWVNTMGKSTQALFDEFQGKHQFGNTSGDVKYHMGYSSDVDMGNGPIHLSLLFNPSHLEYIAPVVMGSVRARQRRTGDNNEDYAVGVVLHGDSAFIGEGIVMETLSMSLTRAYHVGGIIHVVTNNQIGFTTARPDDVRSSRYCSDVAKMIEAPVFHVNADDAEGAIKIMQMAFDYRMRFHKDVVIHLHGYRRHGHQEVDDPRATQPLMYRTIAAHPIPKDIYAKKLMDNGVLDQAQVEQYVTDYRARLDRGQCMVNVVEGGLAQAYAANWAPFLDTPWRYEVDTSIPLAKIKLLGDRLQDYPKHFELLRQVDMVMKARAKMSAGEQLMDWGFAETMAYATLLDQGVRVRFTGEDSQRGTFFHRHALLVDQKTGEAYKPLKHMSDHQAPIRLYDSLLSESGPLGFEYGYSTAEPKALVLWEAQFGDFANVAQVVIDQFISSAWDKWRRLSGLVMLLPHGYEGMGPEHSSARLERFMQLCAKENMQVCVPTTPSQIFHLLRRQALRPFRKPLIVLTPKSLLRHKLAVSPLSDLAEGKFELIIPEIDTLKAADVLRVVLCTGKVYYDLLEKRRADKKNNIAILRIEQLYPFPYEELTDMVAQYTNVTSVIWCQEEPKNQGAWHQIRHRLLECIASQHILKYAGRESMAAPAAGYSALNKQQQDALVEDALTIK